FALELSGPSEGGKKEASTRMVSASGRGLASSRPESAPCHHRQSQQRGKEPAPAHLPPSWRSNGRGSPPFSPLPSPVCRPARAFRRSRELGRSLAPSTQGRHS